MNNRLVGIDIFRLCLTAIVLMFHSIQHINCFYYSYFLQTFISVGGAIVMTGFFMVSGYSIYHSYETKYDFSNIKDISKFYKKRLIGIIPLYYVVSILYIIFLGTETKLTNIILAPIEMLGIQTWFTSMFDYSHNGGTWFISCILLCYFIYPYIQIIVKQISNKQLILALIILCFTVIYIPIVIDSLNLTGAYSNPVFRLFEFIIGVLLCSLSNRELLNNKIKKIVSNKIVILMELILLSIGVVRKYNYNPEASYLSYTKVSLLLFCLMIFGLGITKFKYLNKTKIIPYLSQLCYAAFLSQFFIFEIIKLFNITDNGTKIILTFSLCLLVSIVFHELIEKPSKKILSKLL